MGGVPTMPSIGINWKSSAGLGNPDPTLHSSPSPLRPLPNSVTRCPHYPDNLSKAITKDQTAVSGQTAPGSRACTQPLNLHLTYISQTSYVTCKYPLLLFADTPSPLCLSFAVWSLTAPSAEVTGLFWLSAPLHCLRVFLSPRSEFSFLFFFYTVLSVTMWDNRQ